LDSFFSLLGLANSSKTHTSLSKSFFKMEQRLPKLRFSSLANELKEIFSEGVLIVQSTAFHEN